MADKYQKLPEALIPPTPDLDYLRSMATGSAQAQPVVNQSLTTDERAAFEAWCRREYGRYGEPSMARSPDGYAHTASHPALMSTYASIQMLWEAWRFRAALAQQDAGSLREPKNGSGWRVEWWNESMRLMLPNGYRIESHQHYRNGTMQLTIKRVDAARKSGGTK